MECIVSAYAQTETLSHETMSEAGYIRDGLCRRRNFSNTSQIIRGFLKTSMGMMFEKVTERNQRADELKCWHELCMTSMFLFPLITEALSVYFAFWIVYIFFNCISRTSSLLLLSVRCFLQCTASNIPKLIWLDQQSYRKDTSDTFSKQGDNYVFIRWLVKKTHPKLFTKHFVISQQNSPSSSIPQVQKKSACAVFTQFTSQIT